MDGVEEIELLRKYVEEARHIAFLGGAGVSTASGIPDFRSESGIAKVYRDYGMPYEELLSHSTLFRHPKIFYDFYWKGMVYPEAKPNAAHLALAKLGNKVTIVTQNIDGLHQAAGSKAVIELHGTTKEYRCTVCGKDYSLDEIPHSGIPLCYCGGMIRPEVVLYQEGLPTDAISLAVRTMEVSDLLIVAGTSLVVYPAAGLIDYSRATHKVLINKGTTPWDDFFDLVIHEDIAKVLSEAIR